MTESEKERFEILQEQMDGKLDVIAEGFQLLDRKIDVGLEEAREDRKEIKNQLVLVTTTLSDQIAGNREAIDKNREAIDKNREKIQEVGRKVDKNRERIDEHDRKMDRFIKKTEEHEDRIDRLELV